MTHTSGREKKPYRSPRLEKIGKMSDLTLADYGSGIFSYSDDDGCAIAQAGDTYAEAGDC